jgi:hypothetical protein
LNATNPRGAFVFLTNGKTTDKSTATITYALSGASAGAFALSGTQTINVAADSSNQVAVTPTVTLTADSTLTKPYQQGVSIEVKDVDNCIVYYAVGLVGTVSTLDKLTLQARAKAMPQFSPLSEDQVQFGTYTQVTAGKTTVTVANLVPSTAYEVIAFADSYSGKNSTLQTATFTTTTSGVDVSRYIFNYTTYPTADQRQDLLCAITKKLMVPAGNVRSIHGEVCGNRTTIYKTENATGDIALYFYPLPVDKDTTMTQLATTVAKDDAVKALNETINKNTKVGPLNVVLDETVKAAAVTATFPASPAAGTTSINVTGLSLSASGFIYVALATGSTATPTARDIRRAASGNSTGAFSQIQVLYYAPSSGPVAANFLGLPQGTAHKVFLVGSNNDPSATAYYTAVTALSASTTNQTTVAPSTNAVALATSLLVALISAFAMLF